MSDYHDFVFKDGKLVGKFEEMYKKSTDIPWHQDKTAYTLLPDIDFAILKYFDKEYHFKNVLDIGCGLGYVTNRIKTDLFKGNNVNVVGFDISSTAIKKATDLFGKNILFYTKDLLKDGVEDFENRFDLIYMKDILWYVCHMIDVFTTKIRQMLQVNGCIYVLQSIPDLDDFYGKDVFPTTFSIADYFNNYFDNLYASSTYERTSIKIVGNYEKDKYARYLGKKVCK